MTALTILVVSYDSRGDLERLLPTIPAGDHEVLVVDNHGRDGVAGWLAAEHPEVRVVAAGSNLGYAGGNNLGLRHARGDRVLVLNPDTELAPGALDALHAALDAHPDALVTPTILDGAGGVYACGLEMQYTGITSRIGVGGDPGGYSGVFPVPLPSGTALAARRATLESLGGFDEWFFMYLEDADLAVRARAAGHDILCAADAVIVHHTNPAMTAFKFHWLERNRVPMVRKLTSPGTFRRLLPALALTELAIWSYALLRGPSFLAAKARACAAAWRARRDLAAAPSGTGGWMEGTVTGLPFDQLVGSARLARALDLVTRPLYSLLRPR